MAKFQVQYKNNSKTFNTILEANSYNDIIDLFSDLINCEITEIREIVYENPVYKKDDGNYIKSVVLVLSNDNSYCSIKIPKMKKNLLLTSVSKLVQESLLLSNRKIKNVKIIS